MSVSTFANNNAGEWLEGHFWRTYTQIADDGLLAVAAGAVFYMLLALFPAITALVAPFDREADQLDLRHQPDRRACRQGSLIALV